MITSAKKYFLAIALSTCYVLFSAGQVRLYVNKQAEPDLYNRLTLHTTGWVQYYQQLRG